MKIMIMVLVLCALLSAVPLPTLCRNAMPGEDGKNATKGFIVPVLISNLLSATLILAYYLKMTNKYMFISAIWYDYFLLSIMLHAVTVCWQKWSRLQKRLVLLEFLPYINVIFIIIMSCYQM